MASTKSCKEETKKKPDQLNLQDYTWVASIHSIWSSVLARHLGFRDLKNLVASFKELVLKHLVFINAFSSSQRVMVSYNQTFEDLE